MKNESLKVKPMQKILDKLYALSSNKIGEFANSLIPNAKPMIGVRIPEVRKLAKEIIKDDPLAFIHKNDLSYYELELLQGIVIAGMKKDLMEKLPLINDFIYQIHDWSVCDTFCSSFKLTKKDEDIMWHFLLNYLSSKYEFVKRFVVVMMMGHFLTDKYIDQVIQIVDQMSDDRYYYRMGAAWLIATMMAKYPDKTLVYLQHHHLDDWTYNKALQKMLESYRVSDEMKIIIRELKKKKEDTNV